MGEAKRRKMMAALSGHVDRSRDIIDVMVQIKTADNQMHCVALQTPQEKQKLILCLLNMHPGRTINIVVPEDPKQPPEAVIVAEGNDDA